MKETEFICDFEHCGKRFNKRSRFKSHQQSHSVSRPYACEFEGCGASYAWRHHLKRHIDSIHSHPEKEFKCAMEKCMATFDSEHALSQHTRRSHQAKNEFSCSFCDLAFGKEWQLQEHEASHTKKMPFICDKCSEGFETFSMFKKHVRTHKNGKSNNSQNRQYKCKKCSEIFQVWSAFKKHHVEHTKREELTCKKCNHMFQRKRHLLEHELSVHSEHPKEFRCRIGKCERIYFHEKNLIQHVRQAHEGKLFPCNECGRQLSTKQKLNLHLELHKSDPAPRKPPKKKSVKARLMKQLAGNPDSSLDIDVVVRKKPEIKNSHISYVFAAKQQFPQLALTETDDTENLLRENLMKSENVQV